MRVIKLLSLALFCSVILTACGNNGRTSDAGGKTDTSAKRTNAFFGGGYTGTEVFIPTDSANKMISSYLQSVGAGSGTDTSLHSLIFDGDSLRAYLSSNPNIKHVKVMFAHTLEYINAMGAGHNVGYERGALTVVFGGYDVEGNYVFWQQNQIPNHGSPCPSSCPTIGNAANDLFPIQ
jgi:hypothetical protein